MAKNHLGALAHREHAAVVRGVACDFHTRKVYGLSQ